MNYIWNYIKGNLDITQGRASRRDQWIWLGVYLLTAIIATLAGLAITASGNVVVGVIIGVPLFIYMLLLGWGGLVLQVRRIRDFGYSGWHFLTINAIHMAVRIIEYEAGWSYDVLLNQPATDVFSGTGWVSIIFTIILLVLIFTIRGTRCENKYGKDPVSK